MLTLMLDRNFALVYPFEILNSIEKNPLLIVSKRSVLHLNTGYQFYRSVELLIQNAGGINK